MTDIMQLPRWQRPDEVQRKKAQKHLVYAAGLTGLGLAGMKGAPFAARGAGRAARALKVPVPSAARRASAVVQSPGWDRAGNAVGATGGLLGAGSTLTWGASLNREIKRDEAKLRQQGLAKAARDTWRDYVSDDALAGHRYLKRGEYDKRALAGIPALTAAGGLTRALRGKPISGLAIAGGSAALLPSANRQWTEANRWRDKARRIEARGQDRQRAAQHDFMISKAFTLPRIRRIPISVVRTSPVRRGTFVRTPAGLTTYRRGSL